MTNSDHYLDGSGVTPGPGLCQSECSKQLACNAIFANICAMLSNKGGKNKLRQGSEQCNAEMHTFIESVLI